MMNQRQLGRLLLSSSRGDLDPTAYRFLGWLVGPVHTDEQDRLHCGANRLDSMFAEASALFWAILYVFTMERKYDEVHFHFDAMIVGNAMFADYNVPKQHAVVGFLRMLMQALEATMGLQRLHSHHVKAHRGHPLNESVNSLARWAANDNHVPLPNLNLLELIKDDAFNLKWLWLLARGHQQPDALPCLQDDMLWLDDIRHVHHPDFGPQWTFGYGSSPTHHEIACDCTIMTFNVRTIQGPIHPASSSSAYVHGRMTYLEEQLLEKNVTIAGFQETRNKNPGTSMTANYYKYKTASSNGQGGVELWIHRVHPLGNAPNGPVNFDPSRTTVVFADHRTLLLHAHFGTGCSRAFLIAHAPHKCQAEDLKALWWDNIHRILVRLPGSPPVVALVDANASVGSHQHPGIGNLFVTEEDYNGLRLRQLLDSFALWIPSTFEGIHEGPSETWFSSASKVPAGQRLDYILLPVTWQTYKCTSAVLPDIDVAQSNIDHFALCVTVSHDQCHQPRRLPKQQAKSHKVDWTQVRACRDPAIWNHIFCNLPQPD